MCTVASARLGTPPLTSQCPVYFDCVYSVYRGVVGVHGSILFAYMGYIYISAMLLYIMHVYMLAVFI